MYIYTDTKAMLLDNHAILNAFRAVGRLLGRPAEVLVIGGAAGLLTKQFAPSMVTGDVDLMPCNPANVREDVLLAAERVGHEVALPASWLSDFGGLFRWTLPDDWRDRAQTVGTFDHLTVLAVGRLDLLTMKFLAHRTKDREHLKMMNPTDAELVWIRSKMEGLYDDFPSERSKLDMAMQIVTRWNERT